MRTSGRTCARTCVRLHVHWPRARARTKIRSTGVDLISVRAKRYNTKSTLKRQGRAKIRSTPSEVSLRIAGVEQFYQVKRMIRGIGGVLSSTYSQTLNG